jgi:hypothetical protein
VDENLATIHFETKMKNTQAQDSHSSLKQVLDKHMNEMNEFKKTYQGDNNCIVFIDVTCYSHAIVTPTDEVYIW